MRFKVGDKVRVVKNTGVKFEGAEIGDVGVIENLHETTRYPVYVKMNSEEEIYESFGEDELELFQEENKAKELTFDEIMAYKQPNQTWIGKNYVIHIDEGNNIMITGKENKELGVGVFINTKLKYTLQEKHSFPEAFKSYEEGKTIVSDYGYTYKKENGRDLVNEDGIWVDNDESFTIEEIRGVWYIR